MKLFNIFNYLSIFLIANIIEQKILNVNILNIFRNFYYYKSVESILEFKTIILDTFFNKYITVKQHDLNKNISNIFINSIYSRKLITVMKDNKFITEIVNIYSERQYSINGECKGHFLPFVWKIWNKIYNFIKSGLFINSNFYRFISLNIFKCFLAIYFIKSILVDMKCIGKTKCYIRYTTMCLLFIYSQEYLSFVRF